MRRVVFVIACVAACAPGVTSPDQSPDGGHLSCGPGTVQVGDECLPLAIDAEDRPDASPSSDAKPGTDAAPPPDATPPDAMPPDAAPPDADPAGSQATDYAVDPAHDNGQPGDTVATPLAPAWTATFTGPVSYPLIVGGMAIVAATESQPNVRAVDVATGAHVWGPIVFGAAITLAYDGGRVFALDQNGHLAALDVLTGAHDWSIAINTIQSFYWSPPVAIGGRIYVNGLGEGGTTVAIDEASGDILWGVSTFDGSDGCVGVADGEVYEAEACDQLTAIDATSGAVDWFHSGSCSGGGGAAPAIHDGLIWERDWAEGNIILDTSGHDAGSFAGSAGPAFDGGTVFYTSAGTVSAIDIATSTLLWEFSGDGQLCTSPVVAGGGGQVFVGSSSGKVYELDEATGAQVSVHDIGTPVTCATETTGMSLAEGHLLVPAGNQLVAY